MFETSYGSVEAALMTAHCIPSKLKGAFRGRLAALQKGGVLGRENQPGKGRALRYGPDALHRLVFACEALEFGLAPSVVLSIVEKLWKSHLEKIFREAEHAAAREPGPDDCILFFAGARLLADALADAVPSVGSCPLAKLPDQMAMWMRLAPDDPMQLPPRAMITNLSMRLRSVHSALAQSYMAELAAERAKLLAERAKLDAKIAATAIRDKRRK